MQYCDDFVLGFQYHRDGEKFLQDLKLHLQQFGLNLHKEKSMSWKKAEKLIKRFVASTHVLHPYPSERFGV